MIKIMNIKKGIAEALQCHASWFAYFRVKSYYSHTFHSGDDGCGSSVIISSLYLCRCWINSTAAMRFRGKTNDYFRSKFSELHALHRVNWKTEISAALSKSCSHKKELETYVACAHKNCPNFSRRTRNMWLLVSVMKCKSKRKPKWISNKKRDDDDDVDDKKTM